MNNNKLNIIYEDKYILIVNKPSNLLIISTLKEKEKTLYHQVLLYLKKKNQKVFIVHRLDKDTEGLVIFAKSEKIKKFLQDNWPRVIRKYIAVVKGNLANKEATLKSYLKETKTNLVYETNNKKEGKLAITTYKVILENNCYSLLDINIKTGRKNQIRVQLNAINHPIFGDKKYNNQENSKNKKMYLCAYYLEFIHPITKINMKFEKDIPKEYLSLFFKSVN